MVLVAVDGGADVGQLGEQVHRVLEVVLPVFGLVGARLVGLEEFAVHLLTQQTYRQHGHGVEVLGEGSDEVYVLLCQVASLSPLRGERIELGLVGVPAGGQQEEHAFGEGLHSALGLLSFLAEIGDGMASEGDSADGVEG